MIMNAQLIEMAFSRRQLNKHMSFGEAIALLWEQGMISKGELAEKAISHTSGLRQQAKCHKGSDFEDRSDSKFITVTYYKSTAYACLKSIENKVGTLRVCVHEPKTDRYYYFLLPPRVYNNYKNTNNSMKIWFTKDGQPKPPKRAGSLNLWKYEVTAEKWSGRLKPSR